MPWKSNSKREERVIILMNPNKEGLYYIAIKNSALLRRITSKHSSDYYFLNYIHLKQEGKLKSHKKVFQNKSFRNVVMPFEDTKILRV